jgi:hypothetical protein
MPMQNPYSINPMFTRWLMSEIKKAALYMIDRSTVHLSSNEIFEALIPVEHQDIFRQMGALLRVLRDQTFITSLYYGTTEITVHIKLYGHREITLPIKLNPIAENTKLLEYLTPSLSVAINWSTLEWVTDKLIGLTGDRDMLANLFPWLPDVVRDSGWILMADEESSKINVNYEKHAMRQRWYKNEVGISARLDRIKCDRTFIAATRRRTPAIPLASSIQEAVALGSKLFTQYRLAKQNEDNINNPAKQSRIVPLLNRSLVSSEVIEGMKDTIQIYQYER